MLMNYPTENIAVARDFFVDCADLLQRYDKTIESFYASKTRRLKCFNDLRSAYECALKCAIAYQQPSAMERRKLIELVEKHGHKINRLEAAVDQLCQLQTYAIEARGDVLDQLPVSLRYALDGYDFLEAKEALYYDTIGSNPWLDSFREYIGRVSDALEMALSKHSGIICAADIPLEELFGNKFNKYKKG